MLESQSDNTGANQKSSEPGAVIELAGRIAAPKLAEVPRSLNPADAALKMREMIGIRKVIDDALDGFLVKGVHYGNVPGVAKPFLFQPGALALAFIFELRLDFPALERIDYPNMHREFISKCVAVTRSGELVIASAMGSCSTMEKKYRDRIAELVCPACGLPHLRRDSKKEVFYCWARLGGCGANFELDDPAILHQPRGKVDNPDLADTYNTVLKMAEKRSLVAVVLRALACADRFTQDEDYVAVSQEDLDYHYKVRQKGQDGPKAAKKSTVETIQAAQSALKEMNHDFEEVLDMLELPAKERAEAIEFMNCLARDFAPKNIARQHLVNRAWLRPHDFKAKLDQYIRDKAAAAGGPPPAAEEPQNFPQDDPVVDPDDVKSYCLQNGLNFATLAEEHSSSPLHEWNEAMWTAFARELSMI